MRELKVLQITDSKGGEFNYHSEQVEILLNGRELNETNLFLTYENVIVDIDNDIDETDRNIAKSMEAGAFIRKMYYSEDNMFSEHIYKFLAKGTWNGVEYGEEHGILFELLKDALRYENFIKLVTQKVEVNGYEVIEKQNAIKIIEETPLEEIAKLLINKRVYEECGAVCYLDLEDGNIKVSKDTTKLAETDITIAKYHKSDMLEGCKVNGEYIREYEIVFLSNLLELDEFRQAIEEFYTEEELTMLKEFISEELINEIQKELDEEYERLKKKWINSVIDKDDIHNTMIDDIYCSYCSIPIKRLMPIINEKLMLSREIQIYPYLIVDIQECNISGAGYETEARLHIGYIESHFIENDIEWEKLEEVLGEVEELYDNLDMNMELYLVSCDDEISEDDEDYSPNIEHYSRIVGM